MLHPSRSRPAALALVFSGALLACSTDREPAVEDAGAVPAASGSDAQAVADARNYELTMEKVDRYFAAGIALAKAMRDAPPEQAAELELDGDDSTDDIVETIERFPAARKAVEGAGLSAREYATITYAYMQAGMAAAIIQMRPNDDLDSLAREMKANPKNVRFVIDNAAALDARAKKVAAEVKAIEGEGGDEEGDEQ